MQQPKSGMHAYTMFKHMCSAWPFRFVHRVCRSCMHTQIYVCSQMHLCVSKRPVDIPALL